MAGRKIAIDDLSATIIAEMKAFAGACTEDIKEAQKEAGRQGVAEIKSKAPKKTGTYSKTWKASTTEKGGAVQTILYAGKKGNTTGWALAHLLEFGHAKQNGGRTRAFEHIKPGEDKAAEVFEAELKRRIEQND